MVLSFDSFIVFVGFFSDTNFCIKGYAEANQSIIQSSAFHQVTTLKHIKHLALNHEGKQNEKPYKFINYPRSDYCDLC